MFKLYLLFTFISCILTVYGSGELSILQTPDSLLFSGQELLQLSNVKNVLSTAIGFSIPESPRWSGLVVKDPFHFADAIVVVTVPGVASLDSVQGRTFPLETNEALDNTRKYLFRRISERYPALNFDNLTTIFTSLDKPELVEHAYGSLLDRDPPSLEYLKLTSPEDKAFVNQVNLMDAITAKIADKGVYSDGIPDIHWITVPGIHSLVDTYGSQSKQVEEAKRILSSSILLLSEVFNTAYNDKIVFAVMSSDAVHTRRFRRQTERGKKPPTPGTPTPSKKDSDKPAKDEDFPVMFNIFLWFGIAYFMVLLATSVGIARMDPGRDSIIYRMTGFKGKKEN